MILDGTTLYGTAKNGGIFGNGTIFKVQTNGMGFSVLYNFPTNAGGASTAGAFPVCRLLLDGATLYGTTTSGGSFEHGTVFKINTNGSGYTVLKSFGSGDGADPEAGVAIANDMFYGTTKTGGDYGAGTIFKVGTNGTGFAVLFSFPAAPQAETTYYTNELGASPVAAPVVSGNALYGTASIGGTYGGGVVYKLDLNAVSPVLSGMCVSNQMILNWPGGGLSLQSAPTPTGTFTNIPNASSPFAIQATSEQQYFRLLAN